MTAHQVINHKRLFNFLKAAAAGVSILLTVINWLYPSLTDSLVFSESVFQGCSAYDDCSVEICHSNNHEISITKWQLMYLNPNNLPFFINPNSAYSYKTNEVVSHA